jgi:hypothetical protein
MPTEVARETDAETTLSPERTAQQVAHWVLEELGAPKDLLRVEAKPLWGNYYRVNIYCTKDVGLTAKEVAVTDSFFVYRTEDGCLSDPEVVRKYPNPAA